MKKASIILSHLSSQPQFKLLKRQECYEKYISLLGSKWQKAVAFVYIRENTLFIAVNHPGFKMELNYNKDLLMSLLIQLKKYVKNCSSLEANKVVVFHSKFHPVVKEKKKETTVTYYFEKANGDFDLPKDSRLKELFQATQEIIRCRQP